MNLRKWDYDSTAIVQKTLMPLNDFFIMPPCQNNYDVWAILVNVVGFVYRDMCSRAKEVMLSAEIIDEVREIILHSIMIDKRSRGC